MEEVIQPGENRKAVKQLFKRTVPGAQTVCGARDQEPLDSQQHIPESALAQPSRYMSQKDP